MSKNKFISEFIHIIFDDILRRLGVACPIALGDLIHPWSYDNLVSAPDSQTLRERVWRHTMDQLVLTIQMKGPNQIAAFTCTTVYTHELGIQPWMSYR